jgi:hypothetical protein
MTIDTLRTDFLENRIFATFRRVRMFHVKPQKTAGRTPWTEAMFHVKHFTHSKLRPMTLSTGAEKMIPSALVVIP